MILWINIDYIRKYKEFKEKIQGITSEDQLGMKPGSLTVMLINIFFNYKESVLLETGFYFNEQSSEGINLYQNLFYL